MTKTGQSGPVEFTDELLASIEAVLPPTAPPERVALLPDLLRAWAEEDLGEHLSREGRAAFNQRTKRRTAVGKRIVNLFEAIRELDENDLFQIACGPQMRREARIGNARWDRPNGIADRDGNQLLSSDLCRLLGPDDIEGARRRRDEALSWLYDLAEFLIEPRPKSPPDKKTLSYLVVLDLAAIFELVSGEPATRRIDFDSGATYGPFWSFVKPVWSVIFNSERGLSSAVKIWAGELRRQEKLRSEALAHAAELLGGPLSDPEHEAIAGKYGQFSPFIANLQFRRPNLWRKLKVVR